MKKKILYICPSSGVGGAETFLKATANYRNTERFENTYLLFSSGPLERDLRNFNVHVECLKKRPRLSNPADHIRVGKKINQLIQDRNIQMAHSTMAYSALFAALPLQKNGIPHSWFQHGPASGWMDRAAGVLPHDLLFSNSNYTTQKQLELESPLKPFVPKHRKIVKILLGTDDIQATMDKKEQAKRNLLTKLPLSRTPLVISMLCRIQRWKGVHILLEAVSLMKKRNSMPRDLIICLWGEAFKGNTYLESLKKMVADHQLPVHFMGLTNDPKSALLASDVVVNASIQPEPFGLSVIEAMAAMAAVIVPKEGGPAEIFGNSGSGSFFEPRNPVSLSEALVKVSDLQELPMLQKNALKRFQNAFTADRMIHELESSHNTILEAR